MSNEQSIRDALAAVIHENFNACRGRNGVSPDALASVILASPVIHRIQAEALRSARADIQAYTDSGSPFGHRPVEQFLDNRADRIERGETA